MDLELAALLRRRGISDDRVLAAIASLSRAEFMPEEEKVNAGADAPVPIGFGQTISQPFVVAFMTEALSVQPGHRVLEVGTGSGYQAAVLASLGARVFTIERVPELAQTARATLDRLGFSQVRIRRGDGSYGWREEGPFDRIMVTAASGHLPERLLNQLDAPGRLIAPVGEVDQELISVIRDVKGELSYQSLLPVRFVPLIEDAPKPS